MRTCRICADENPLATGRWAGLCVDCAKGMERYWDAYWEYKRIWDETGQRPTSELADTVDSMPMVYTMELSRALRENDRVASAPWGADRGKGVPSTDLATDARHDAPGRPNGDSSKEEASDGEAKDTGREEVD